MVQLRVWARESSLAAWLCEVGMEEKAKGSPMQTAAL